MKFTTTAVLAVAALAGTSVSAQSILDFAFNSTLATYTPSSPTAGTLVANGVAGGAVQTSGNVARLVSPTGTANFDAGAAANAINFSLNVSGIGPNSALGAGNITLRDANGDTLTAVANGTFVNGGNFIFFNGFLSNVVLNNNSGDGLFNGTSGGSFPLNFTPVAGPGPYTGAIAQLTFNNVSNFFNTGFTSTDNRVIGNVIPAPASMALLALGGLMAGRRRR